MTGFFAPLAAGAAVLLAGPGDMGFAAGDAIQYGLSRRAVQLLVILAGALGMVLLGYFDDRYELGPAVKFTGQLVFAAAVAWSGIRITLFIPDPLINGALTVLWILALTNAFNFMDNMNGLCTGLGIVASWSCAWAAAIQGQYLVAILGFLFCGALLGFFPYNFPRASAFLGDAGSHLTGFLVAILAIMPSFYSSENPDRLAVLAPLLIVALPLFDLCSVVIIRLKAGKPVYVGDNNHISHRLARSGFSKSTAVLLILLANAATSAVALLVL